MVPRRQSCIAFLAAGLLWLCGVPPAHAMHAWPSDGVQNIPISTVKTRVGDFSFAASGRLPWRHELSPANTPGSRGCGYEMASGRAFWNERDPNYLSFCGGDPINGFDADGRLSKQFYQTSVSQANAVMGWTDDTIINTVAGAGYLADSAAGFVTGDPGFASAAQDWQNSMSPYARQGYYNPTAPVAQIASAGVMFVDPESAAGRVGGMESTVVRDTTQANLITDPARMLPENSTATTATQPSFYVTPNGTAIPATGYRAIGSDSVAQAEAGNIMSGSGTTYVTFTDISAMSGSEAGSVLQIPYTPSHFATFDTLQIIDDLHIPGGEWGASSIPEPITTSFPEFGKGGATQATTGTPILNYTLQPFTKP